MLARAAHVSVVLEPVAADHEVGRLESGEQAVPGVAQNGAANIDVLAKLHMDGRSIACIACRTSVGGREPVLWIGTFNVEILNEDPLRDVICGRITAADLYDA